MTLRKQSGPSVCSSEYASVLPDEPEMPGQPFFLTRWEREDYERAKRGEPELGPPLTSQHQSPPQEK